MALAKFNSSNPRRTGESGFSLIETMIATMLLATALVSTAQLMVVAIRGNSAAQRSTFTTALAQDKIEQLRGLTWGYDEVQRPTHDYTTNLGVNPPTDDGVGLTPSPANALSANTTGYVDYVTRDGTVLGS